MFNSTKEKPVCLSQRKWFQPGCHWKANGAYELSHSSSPYDCTRPRPVKYVTDFLPYAPEDPEAEPCP